MRYFDKNWNNITEKWVYFACSAFCLGNSTTNRLESFHDKLKQLTDRNAGVDELLGFLTLIMNCVTHEQEQKLFDSLLRKVAEDDLEMRYFTMYTSYA
jgi:hypothetical protein